MSSKAPIEIWHTILKYSISVPLFFDPDPVSTYGIDGLREYSYEAPYWASERIRNSLRRVCCRWNLFLKGYNHRFIRLFDVMHGRVPITALPFAIRLDLDDSYHCKCKEFCEVGVKKRWLALENTWNTASLPIYGEAVRKTAEPDHWRLEIINGWLSMDSFYNDLKTRAPRIKAMISQSAVDEIPICLPPGLKLFMTRADEPRQLFDIGKSSSLVTLHIMVQSLRAPVAMDSLPALRHLSINTEYYGEFPSKEKLYSFLKSIGPKLRTFHLRQALFSISIDQCIWDLLPNAERLQLPHRWIDCKVPPGHPLQAIQISIQDLRPYKNTWERIILPHLPFYFESHQVVRIDRNWSEELASHLTLPLLMKIQDYYERLDIPLLDACGETLSQYILFVIKTFWRQRVKIARKPQRDYVLEKF